MLTPVMIGGSLLLWTANLILPLAILRHIMALMRRIPRLGLILYAKIEFWVGLACGLMLVGGMVMMMFVAIPAFTATATMTVGPNMPMYAGGPNMPGGTTATSVQTMNSLGYVTTPGGPNMPGGPTTTGVPPAAVPFGSAPSNFIYCIVQYLDVGWGVLIDRGIDRRRGSVDYGAACAGRCRPAGRTGAGTWNLDAPRAVGGLKRNLQKNVTHIFILYPRVCIIVEAGWEVT